MTGDLESTVYDFALGSDHAGFELKEALKRYLGDHKKSVLDHGTISEESVDYPDFAKQVAQSVQTGKTTQGILVCGTGVGMSITANRVAGIRAALVFTPFMAEMARAHNDANILCMGARVITFETAKDILSTWMSTSFEGGRHARRVQKMEETK